HGAEDCRVRADAEREGDHGDRGKPGSPCKSANGVAQVTGECHCLLRMETGNRHIGQATGWLRSGDIGTRDSGLGTRDWGLGLPKPLYSRTLLCSNSLPAESRVPSPDARVPTSSTQADSSY